MSDYQHEIKRAPIGMNDNADPSLMPQQKCSLMVGLSQTAPGVLTEALRKKIAFPQLGINAVPPAGNFEGIFPYNTDLLANDRLLVVKGGLLYKATITANQPQAVADSLKITMSDLTLVTNSSGINFTAAKRVRAVQHKNEVFFVQDGGLQPVRFNGTALFKVGVTAPGVPAAGATVAGPPNNLNGTYQYWVTDADELGRESNPSPALTVTLVNRLSQTVNFPAASGDAQVQRRYLYRTTAGGTIGYRVLEAGYVPGAVSAVDAVTDALIVFNSQSPRVGEADVPLPASLIGVWKNRVILNSTADRETLQISNLDSVSQFPAIGDPLFATDGTNLRCTNEFGDEITAMAPFGTVLAVLHRRALGGLFGDTVATFSYKHMDRTGCIASDSLTECIDKTLFMGEDGVYAMRYDDAFNVVKVSKDLDTMFQSVAVQFGAPGVFPFATAFTRDKRAAAAVGKFMQNRYYLFTPPYTAILDFETGGWSLDYMTGMPYGAGDAGQSGFSRGYLSAEVINVDRQYQVLIYNPGITADGGVNGGYLYVGSFYPLTPDGVTDTFPFIYETRAIDGAGVHRERRKRMKRTSQFGEIDSVFNTSGALVSAATFAGTITIETDAGIYTETYNFGMSGTFANYFNRDQQEGKLFVQEWLPKAAGRILMTRIVGTATGRLFLRDQMNEYIPLD